MPDQIPHHAADFLASIEAVLGDPSDLNIEEPVPDRLTIIYLSALTNGTDLQDNLIAPLLGLANSGTITWELVLRHIPEKGRRPRQNLQDLATDLRAGRAVVYLAGEDLVYTFASARHPNLQPGMPQVERTVRGPKVAISEIIDDNLLMIRRGLKDKALKVKSYEIGRRSQTRVDVLYLDDVADPGIVQQVDERLHKIDIDGIVSICYIDQLITDNRWSLFPLTQYTERLDKVLASIFEGRVVLLADGSSSALIVPTVVNELYQSPEDYYFNLWSGSFLRAFRILGNNIAVALPGLYIALVGVNPELLPIKFALTISVSRMGVALPLLMELLLMEVIIEIFREGSLRLPTTVSQTLGVTAGVVLGLAAVGAGLVSNATLVVVVITAIASYSGPNYEIGLSWRILRFALIFAAAWMGLFGLTMAGLCILAHAAFQNSFGIGYLSPWSPLRLRGLLDTVLRRPIWLGRRLEIYHPADKVRYREKGGEEN